MLSEELERRFADRAHKRQWQEGDTPASVVDRSMHETLRIGQFVCENFPTIIAALKAQEATNATNP